MAECWGDGGEVKSGHGEGGDYSVGSVDCVVLRNIVGEQSWGMPRVVLYGDCNVGSKIDGWGVKCTVG